MSEEIQQPALPPIKLAFILDGEVVDILHTDERLSSIFLSNPLIVNVTNNLLGEGGIVSVGSKYDYDKQEFISETTENTQEA